MNIVNEVLAAEKRIRPHIRETILDYSPYYSRLAGAKVYFKLENLQETGSFKVRGAYNRLCALSPEQRRILLNKFRRHLSVSFMMASLRPPTSPCVPMKWGLSRMTSNHQAVPLVEAIRIR